MRGTVYIAKLRRAELNKYLSTYMARLKYHGWEDINIEEIEQEHKDLLEDDLKDFQTAQKKMNQRNRRYQKLQEFTGVVTIFPNTSRVEADFSTISQEKTEYREYLSNFSLSGILHARQARELDLFGIV